MTQEERETIVRNTIGKFGYLSQLRQLQEECAELIVAVSHHIRVREGSRKELIEELADVTIMLMQLIPPFDTNNEITDTIDYKLLRISKKL